MSDAPAPPVCEWRPRHLVIIPGLSYEEWESEVWAGVRQAHDSSNFLIGDCLVYSEKHHGERWSQAVDAEHAQQYEQCRWVCSRIEPARRRENLKWSIHRAVAVLDPADQDLLLDRAAAEHWNTQQTEEAKKALKAERAAAKADYPRNGGPLGDGDDEQPGAGAEPVCEIAERAVQGAPDAAAVSEDTTGRTGGSIPPTGASDIEELRACIRLIHDIAPSLAAGTADPGRCADIAERLLFACGADAAPYLLDGEIPAAKLIPSGWSMSNANGQPGSWSVELRCGNGKFAVGTGPLLVLALTESALAARISEASA